MNERLAQYTTKIVEALKPMNTERIILFGSGARNQMHLDSDLDLLIVLDEERIPETYEEKLSMRVKVKTALRCINEQIAIDVIAYTKAEYREMIKAPGSFLKEVTQTGRMLYEKTSQGVA